MPSQSLPSTPQYKELAWETFLDPKRWAGDGIWFLAPRNSPLPVIILYVCLYTFLPFVPSIIYPSISLSIYPAICPPSSIHLTIPPSLLLSVPPPICPWSGEPIWSPQALCADLTLSGSAQSGRLVGF